MHMPKKDEFTWDNVVTIAAQAGAAQAIQEYKKLTNETEKFRRDKRYHNTKLLLKHYRDFREHVKNSVYSDGQIDQNRDADDWLELMETVADDEIYIKSIMRTRKRTEIILAHINIMMDFYEAQGEKDATKALRHDVITSIYRHGNTFEETAEKMKISTGYVYRLERHGIEDLSVLLFGIDGLKFER
jgi:uncharacterized protein (DUF885 family)